MALDHNSAFNNPRTLFQLLGVNGNSWLLAQGDSRFKACSNSDYASRVTLRDGIVWMQWEWESQQMTIADSEESYALPETGGIGTAIFYIVGAAMVIGVIVIAVTRRRMDAVAHNEKLKGNQISYHLTEEGQAEYNSLLDINANGIMGYIDIPSISCNLPIYHGTEDTVLQIAIGHLE